MKEELFKKLIIIILLLNPCFLSDLSTYNFIYTTITPISISTNNIGFKSSKLDEEIKIFLHMQNWVAENLYFSGGISPSTNNKINIIYNLNMGYKTKLNKKIFQNIYYDFGYFYKRYESKYTDKQKWISLSFIFGVKLENSWLLPSVIYIFNNEEEKNKNQSILSINYLRNMGKKLILNLNLQLFDDKDSSLIPSIGLKYKI